MMSCARCGQLTTRRFCISCLLDGFPMRETMRELEMARGEVYIDRDLRRFLDETAER